MNPRFRTTLLALLFLLSAVGLAWSQPELGPEKQPVPIDKEAAKKPKDDGSVPLQAEPKDPTSPSPKLKELLNPDKAGKYSPAGPGPKMPMMVLRGRVVSKSQPPVALLEVEGKFYSITKGSALPGGNNTILRILDITSQDVRIEVHPLKEIIILR